MNKILTAFIPLFYIGIMMFVAFGICNIHEEDNFLVSIVFQLLADAFLFAVVCIKLFSTTFKTPYFTSLLMVSVFYTLINNVVNTFLIGAMESKFLVLINLLLLFVYCCLAIPFVLMGSKKDN